MQDLTMELERGVAAGRDVGVRGMEGLWSRLASWWRAGAGKGDPSRMGRREWK